MKPTRELQTSIKKMIDELPHAFDAIYWSMGDTTYKEELFLAFIRGFEIKQEDALKLQSKILPRNKIVRKILKEEVTECMGRYGVDFPGTTFYGTKTKVHQRK